MSIWSSGLTFLGKFIVCGKEEFRNYLAQMHISLSRVNVNTAIYFVFRTVCPSPEASQSCPAAHPAFPVPSAPRAVPIYVTLPFQPLKFPADLTICPTPATVLHTLLVQL